MAQELDSSSKELLTFISSITWRIGQSLQHWAAQLLESLAQKTGVLQGAMYSADTNQEFLYLTATYAVGNYHLLQKKIAFGDGLLGHVAKSRKPRIIHEDIPEHFHNYISSTQIIPHSIMILPVVYSGVTYGVIEFTHLTGFCPNDIAFLEAIVQTSGIQLVLLVKEQQLQTTLNYLNDRNNEIVVQNQQLELQKEEIAIKSNALEAQKEQLQTAYHNMQLMSDLGQKITSTLDLILINEMVYKYVGQLMPVAAFGIGLYNPKKQDIEFNHFRDGDTILPTFHKSLKLDDSLAVWCFLNKKDVFINNLDHEYQSYIPIKPVIKEYPEPKAMLLVPLMVGDSAIGVVTVNNYHTRTYSSNDLTNLKTLASYIAIALDNASAYKTIRLKNQSIQDSILYAQTIQKGLLPLKANIDKYFDNFILYKPKDIVSGDFYWFSPVNSGDADKQSVIVAVVDCTGHGVPGAFMSFIGNNIIGKLALVDKIVEPKEILERLNIELRALLHQDELENDDGMDVCLCRIDMNTKKPDHFEITFAGAKRPLFHYSISDNALIVHKGSIKSIGGRTFTHLQYSQSQIHAQSGDILYLTTDGYIDQGNREGKKFGNNKFCTQIEQSANKPIAEQFEIFERELKNYQNKSIQRDDITVVALKL